MPISEHEIERLARLAHLDLDPEEKERLTRDLGAILAYVERLAEMEDGITDEPAPMTRLREDVPQAPLAPGIAVSIAPDRQNELFRVPPVLGPERAKTSGAS
jgi:aspartyl-tRNA(Asn)/glutamyl-tRNA(Gln) amidotransferase subunit C